MRNHSVANYHSRLMLAWDPLGGGEERSSSVSSWL